MRASQNKILAILAAMSLLPFAASTKEKEQPKEPIRIFVSTAQPERGSFVPADQNPERMEMLATEIRKWGFGKKQVEHYGTELVSTPEGADVVIKVVGAAMVQSATYHQEQYESTSVPQKVELVKLIVTVGSHNETVEGRNDGTAIWFAGPDTYWKNAAELAYEQARDGEEDGRSEAGFLSLSERLHRK